MFGSPTDYHGSRAYAAGAPRGRGSRRLRLRLSLTFAWLKLRIGKFLRSAAPVSETTWLVRGGQRHFSLLGAVPSKPARPAITDIFPLERDDRALLKRPRRPD